MAKVKQQIKSAIQVVHITLCISLLWTNFEMTRHYARIIWLIVVQAMVDSSLLPFCVVGCYVVIPETRNKFNIYVFFIYVIWIHLRTLVSNTIFRRCPFRLTVTRQEAHVEHELKRILKAWWQVMSPHEHSGYEFYRFWNQMAKVQKMSISFNSNTTGGTCGARTTNPFGAHEFTPTLRCSIFSLLCKVLSITACLTKK
jgi:hypothetical protein